MVYITGDIHGSADPLYDLFGRFHPTEEDIIVLLGDVGVNYTGQMRDRLLKQELCEMKSTFFCIHGNHENRPQNICSYALARKRVSEGISKVLVLNLASPVHPGGGVRRGARAQEEDLCRKSSLLQSLESKEASKYYEYNKRLHSFMGSDALMLTSSVEIIKDENGALLDDSIVVSVLTCAAPKVSGGKEGMNETAYRQLVYNRIAGMLKSAAFLGYRHLILGAWGCGAYGNDASVISDLFRRALNELDYNGFKENDLFSRIDFAVLDRTPALYNYKQFNRNFGT